VIGPGSFAGATWVDRVSFEGTRVQVIGERAFEGAGISEAKLPSTVARIEGGAFDYTCAVDYLDGSPPQAFERWSQERLIYPAVSYGGNC
jgi:hypothetical protein